MIGVLGGTFDPIHYGHLRSALEVKELFNLKEVHLIPSAMPPHREQPNTRATDRLAMLKLAIAEQSGLSADDRELKRPGPSYMVDTLQSIRLEVSTETPILLFIGTDAFLHLQSWYQWQHLFNLGHIVVMTRPGFKQPEIDQCFTAMHTDNPTELALKPAGKLYFQAVTQLDISATDIRNRFAQHKNPGFLLPDTVIAYIKQHQLYQRH